MYHSVGLLIEPRSLYYNIGRVLSLYKNEGGNNLITLIDNHITNTPSYILSQQRDGRIARVAPLMRIAQRSHIGTSSLVDSQHAKEIRLQRMTYSKRHPNKRSANNRRKGRLILGRNAAGFQKNITQYPPMIPAEKHLVAALKRKKNRAAFFACFTSILRSFTRQVAPIIGI